MFGSCQGFSEDDGPIKIHINFNDFTGTRFELILEMMPSKAAVFSFNFVLPSL
jgi:hypothetical protein